MTSSFFRNNGWKMAAALLMVGFGAVAHPFAQTRIAGEDIRAKVAGKIARIYQGEPVRFEIEWVTRLSEWEIGQRIDSIAVRYPPTRRPRGQTVLRVEACHQGRVVRRLSYTVNVRVFRRVAVCKTKIYPHQPLTPDQFEWREAEITQLPGEPVQTPAQLQGMQARRLIRPESILVSDAITPIPLIHRGGLVTLRYETENVRIDMQARALQNGGPDEVIWFFYPENRKRYKARVINEELAIVQP